MIQVLVSLSESAYKEMCENGVDNVDYDIRQMMKNSTPLPKGHGRLIDADALYEQYAYADYNFDMAMEYVPTIIEADKENEE